MLFFARLTIFFHIFFLSFFALGENTFKVVAYNVENLFDTDGVSLYSDYKPEFYGETEFANKINTIVRVLQKIGGSQGPEIILFQEIEVDRTPNREKSATERLVQLLHKKGLGPYNFSLGYNPSSPPETWPSVQCLTLSKFPIASSRLLPLYRARPILETNITVEGEKFTIFNNHWKSGASSSKMESIRMKNAEVLRKRIDQLLNADPFHDFLVGGDLNSHYNQSTVYRKEMRSTGINQVLLSTNKEPKQVKARRELYNLWHELSPDQRGSDAWRGKWGTLMHILLPVGLYDNRGIRYQEDSFEVCKFSALNMTKGANLPMKWSNDLNGFGASDHFPISANFRTAGKAPLVGNHFSNIETEARAVDFSTQKEIAEIWNPNSLKPENFGAMFNFSGKITDRSPLTLTAAGHRLGLYSFNLVVRNKLFTFSQGAKISGIGHLSRYRGQWQFIIEKEDWIK